MYVHYLIRRLQPLRRGLSFFPILPKMPLKLGEVRWFSHISISRQHGRIGDHYFCVCVWMCLHNLYSSSLPHAQLIQVFICGKYLISDRFCSVKWLYSLVSYYSGLYEITVVSGALGCWGIEIQVTVRSSAVMLCLLFCHHWLFLFVRFCSLALSLDFCFCMSLLACLFCCCS